MIKYFLLFLVYSKYMKYHLNLFIFLFSMSSYSSIVINDSIIDKKDSIIDYVKELNKFKSYVSENLYPSILTKEFFLLDKKIIIDNTENLNKLYKLSQRNTNPITRNYNLETSGSISRGITIGNNQNSVLNSELDLQISGKLSEKVSIKASIQDSSIPLQDNGYSQQLDEFDQIFIEIESEKWTIRGGDIDLKRNNSFFGNFEKRIQGLSIDYKINKSIEFEAAGAIVKGKYKRSKINSQNGNQGPYKLIGQNGELYVLIVSGSESVFVNGIKIDRGIDKDYVINYNAGEIIFNSKFPIMADMRIEVEYQLSEKNFNSFISYSGVKIKKNKFTHNISIYNEGDLKNQPLLQNLSNDQKEILSSAGDNDQLMNAPSGSISQFNENRILYKKEVVNGIEIYVYSNNPNDELYSVNFSNVGENQGDYILKVNNTIDNIYEYISPVNGEKQGSYTSQTKLIAPEKLQLIIYNTSFEYKKNSRINFELASSINDNNLFSTIDDSDNNGFASRFSYLSKDNINEGIILNSEVDINYINNNFQTIERIFNTEFSRNWNLNEVFNLASNRLLGNLKLGIQKENLGSIGYKLEKLEFGNNYKGTRNSFEIKFDELKDLEIYSISSLTRSKENSQQSKFIKSNNILDYNYNLGWAILQFNYEKKTGNEEINSLLNPDFGQKHLEIKKGIGIKDKSFIEFGYRKRINDSVINGNLQSVNHSDTYFLESQVLNSSKTKLNLYINQNKLVSNQNNSTNDFLNTRLIYNQKAFKNIFNSSLFFETNSGNLPQQEYTFLEVEPGLGSYKWIDVNNNNIQELEEFEIAVFEDEGTYIRVLLPNQVFIKTYQNKFNYSNVINFSKWQNSDKKIKKLFSKISNQFQYSIDKKNNLDTNPEIDINPFQIDKENLLAYNYNIKNVFYLNKAKQRYSLIFTYSNSEVKNNFSFGSTKNSINFKRLNIIHKIGDIYLFEFIANRGNKSNWSENYVDKNYILIEEEINPKLTYLAGENNRINFIYKKAKINNQLGQQEFLNQQQFGISVFLNQKEKRGFTSEFNYYKNGFEGESDSIISYVIMNGLQNGENYTWSFKFEKKLSKLLDINFVYYGRKSPNSRSIHNGSIQLKAIF